MAASWGLSKILALWFIANLMLLSSTSPSLAVGESGSQAQQLGEWIPVRSGCRAAEAGCLTGGEEFELDSEVSRRILATSRYISYGSLQRNTVPCSRRGASYYNCRAGAQANPYSRGCSTITRCRG
ncbi:hypothetical protein NMG60_11032211 [Bertholletia excelsa]